MAEQKKFVGPLEVERRKREGACLECGHAAHDESCLAFSEHRARGTTITLRCCCSVTNPEARK